MRYCIVTSSLRISKNAKSGFYQWANAFDAPVLTPEKFLIEHYKVPFDVIHVSCGKKEYDLLSYLCIALKDKGKSVLITSIDRLLPNEPFAIQRWKMILEKVDLVLGADQSICNDLFLKTGIQAYELSPPVDYDFYKSDSVNLGKKECFTVVTKNSEEADRLLKGIQWILKFRFKVQHVDPELSEDHLWAVLKSSRLVMIPEGIHDGGRVAVLAALAKCIVISSSDYDAGRMLYPFITFPSGNISRIREIFLWLLTSDDFRDSFIETAEKASLNFNWANKRDQMINRLQYHFPQLKIQANAKANDTEGNFSIAGSIHHYYGPEEVEYGQNECVVVCLLKNGEEHLPSFLKHYRQLGIAHFIFVDNGSTDKTLGMLTFQPDVTIYKTDLPHRYFEIEIRKIMVEKHCKYRWCLLVDVDELFDYPSSGSVPFYEVLNYLRSHKYTAMTAQMLDMYSSSDTVVYNSEGMDLKQSYRDYDISGIRKSNYFDPWIAAYNRWNRLASSDIQSYWGGVRKTVFKGIKHYNILTKHPLIFLDGELNPVTNAHFSDKASVADISAVLYHYKFVPSFSLKVRDACNQRSYVKFAQNEYDAYYKFMKKEGAFYIHTPNTQRLYDVNELVLNGFLKVSQEYLEYMHLHDEILQPASH